MFKISTCPNSRETPNTPPFPSSSAEPSGPQPRPLRRLGRPGVPSRCDIVREEHSETFVGSVADHRPCFSTCRSPGSLPPCPWPLPQQPARWPLKHTNTHRRNVREWNGRRHKSKRRSAAVQATRKPRLRRLTSSSARRYFRPAL